MVALAAAKALTRICNTTSRWRPTRPAQTVLPSDLLSVVSLANSPARRGGAVIAVFAHRELPAGTIDEPATAQVIDVRANHGQEPPQAVLAASIPVGRRRAERFVWRPHQRSVAGVPQAADEGPNAHHSKGTRLRWVARQDEAAVCEWRHASSRLCAAGERRVAGVSGLALRMGVDFLPELGCGLIIDRLQCLHAAKDFEVLGRHFRNAQPRQRHFLQR